VNTALIVVAAMDAGPQLVPLLVAVGTLCGVASTCFLASYACDRAGQAAGAASSPGARRAAYCSFVTSVAALSAGWYAVSVSLTLFNRLVIGYGGAKFSLPAVLTTCHMVVKGILATATALVAGTRRLRPEIAALPLWPRMRATGRALIHTQGLTQRVVLFTLVPIGVATALDVWLSNLSLRTIAVSTYTVAKSTALVWNLLLSLLLRLHKPSAALVLTVALIAAGVVMSSYKQAGFHAGGFVCALGAAAAAAVRWVVTQRYLERPDTEANIQLLVALAAPITVVAMLPALALELPKLAAMSATYDGHDVAALAGAAVGGGVLAFLLLVVELQLVRMTSALSLNVIGHAKDALVILLAIAALGEHLAPVNAAGVATTIAAALMYSVVRGRAVREAITDTTKPRAAVGSALRRGRRAGRAAAAAVSASALDGGGTVDTARSLHGGGASGDASVVARLAAMEDGVEIDFDDDDDDDDFDEPGGGSGGADDDDEFAFDDRGRYAGGAGRGSGRRRQRDAGAPGAAEDSDDPDSDDGGRESAGAGVEARPLRRGGGSGRTSAAAASAALRRQLAAAANAASSSVFALDDDDDDAAAPPGEAAQKVAARGPQPPGSGAERGAAGEAIVHSRTDGNVSQRSGTAARTSTASTATAEAPLPAVRPGKRPAAAGADKGRGAAAAPPSGSSGDSGQGAPTASAAVPVTAAAPGRSQAPVVPVEGPLLELSPMPPPAPARQKLAGGRARLPGPGSRAVGPR
jgi:solute carrier family 35 protein C2